MIKKTVREGGTIGLREKILFSGDENLLDEDLVALLVGSGVKDQDARQVAIRLLKGAGGLRRLSNRRSTEIMAVEGIGPARAARLLATFGLARRLSAQALEPGQRIRSSRDIFTHYHTLFRDKKREIFMVLLLDSKNRLLGEERISEGSLNGAIVHPREVFQSAIRESAASILAIHNHPSGDPSPSEEDYRVTLRLKEAGELLGIHLLDHVILGEFGFVSFREHRLMRWEGEGEDE
jgi:DNA repair protein RadC